jgi:hypothetical protein
MSLAVCRWHLEISNYLWQFARSILPESNLIGTLPLAFGNIKMPLAVC